VLAAAVGLLLAKCDEGPPEAPTRPTTAERPDPGERQPTPGLEEKVRKKLELPEVEEPTPAWPAQIEDLEESLEAFTSLKACSKGLRQQMPTAIAEAIADIGYTKLIDDVCASLRAVKEGNPKACGELSVSALQQGCRTRVALVHGNPRACPEDPVLEGREPTCLAWALRAPGMCRAASSAERNRCRAVLEGEADACDSELESSPQRCRAQVRRYASSLQGKEQEAELDSLEPTLRATVRRSRSPDGGLPDGAAAGQTHELTQDEELARGVYLKPVRCGWKVQLGESPGGGLVLGRGAPRLQMELEIPAGAELPVELPFGPDQASVRIRLPGGAVNSSADSTGTVVVKTFHAKRGAKLEGEIEMQTSGPDRTTSLEGRFVTFVRDRGELPEGCAPEQSDGPQPDGPDAP
jgi:hypothetical protein